MFVVFNYSTTKALTTKSGYSVKTFKTAAAAKAAITRMGDKSSEYDFAEYNEYFENISKMVERTNAMTGKTFMEDINTPFSVSPSSENYWCS